nr:hypothetical protein [Tanacetum cinerariifolium]
WNEVVTPLTDPEIEQLAINDELGFVIHHEFGYINLQFWFSAQSVRSSNTVELDSPYLLVLITGTSQSRQHGKSESDSYYLSDRVVNSYTGSKLISRFPFIIVNTKEYHSDCSGNYHKDNAPNGKLIHNSIINGPYVRRMTPEPGDPNREVPVNETFHVLTDDELTEKELEQIEADDQVIHTILLGFPEDNYAAVDSCETIQEILLRVQQMMKGSDIGIQEKKAKLFNEWERFTSTDGESIESYYHHFLKLINDLKRNKHFPKKITSNLKFLNNLQPERSRHVTIVHQTKDLHTADYTQLYDFLKYNKKEVDDLKSERLARTQDPLALIATSKNPYTFPVLRQDQPSFNPNYMQQPMPNPEDITDPTTAMNMALALMAKAFKLNYSTPTNNNKRISSNPRNRQITQPGNANQNPNGNGNLVVARAEVKPRRRDAAYLQTQLLIAQKKEAGIQLQAKEFDLMVAAADLDEIEEVNANCILMANL